MKRLFYRLTAALCAAVFLLAVLLGCGSQLVPALAIATAFATIAILTVCSVTYLSGSPRASPQLSNCHPSNRYAAGIGQAAFRQRVSTLAEEHDHGRLCQLQANGSTPYEQGRIQSSSVFHFVITFFSGLFFYARDRDVSHTTSFKLRHDGTSANVSRPNLSIQSTIGPICPAA